MNKIENPFLVYGYEGPEFFCDRESETETMISGLQNGCNLTLMSPRRYGKTGLIQHVFHRVKEENHDVACFYVDLYATKTLSDLVQALAKAIIGKLDTPRQKIEGFIATAFKSSQITMSTDLITGLPEFGLSFQPHMAESTLADIFAYIAQSGRKCYVALDEFQQVREYPEGNVEALLRTYIQQTHNIHFIFAGSKLHLMNEMFNSPRHPFYRSTERLNLYPIPESAYYNFASEKLQKKNVQMSEDVFHTIYILMDGVTWYLQTILNHLYRLHDCEIDVGACNEAILYIIRAEEDDYKRLLHMLTANQASLLRSIAVDGCVKEPMSGKFIREHQLKSTSSVQRALQFLCNEEYVYHSEGGYIIYDRFFGHWLRSLS